MADEPEPLPELPAMLTEGQKQRYLTIAAVVRRTTERLPHPADKFTEPAHVFSLHLPRRSIS
jgi:hypothetical protein